MRWQRLTIALLAIAALMAIALPGMTAKKITVRLLTMQQAGMTTDEINATITEFQKKNPGIIVEPTYVAYEALHDKIVTSTSGKSAAYDLVLVDDPWYPQFAQAGWLLDVSKRITKAMKADIYPASWDVVRYKGKLWGMPWLLDEKYLFYNKDICAKAGFTAPPKSWEQLVEQAKAIKQKGLVEYPIIWSWKQHECSICDWVVLLYANGGEFFDQSGVPVFNSPQGVETLSWMVQTVKDGVSNPASTTSLEDDCRLTMQQGKAAFELNWIYLYNMSNDPKESKVVGQIDFALIPPFAKAAAKGVKSSSVNGSMAFSIAANSKLANESWRFLEFICGKYIQKKYPKNVTPIWMSLAKDPGLQKVVGPGLKAFAAQFPYAHVRPKDPTYAEASTILQVAIQEALLGRKDPKQALDDAVVAIKQIE